MISFQVKGNQMMFGSRAFAQRVLNESPRSNHHRIYVLETEKILQEFVNLRKIDDYKVYMRRSPIDLYVHTWERGREYKFSYYIQESNTGTCRSSHTRTTYEIRDRVENMFVFSRLSKDTLRFFLNPPTEIEIFEEILNIINTPHRDIIDSCRFEDRYREDLFKRCRQILCIFENTSRQEKDLIHQYTWHPDWIPTDYHPILDVLKLLHNIRQFSKDDIQTRVDDYYSRVRKNLKNHTIDDHIPIILSYLL